MGHSLKQIYQSRNSFPNLNMSDFSSPFFFGGKIKKKTNHPIFQVLKTDYTSCYLIDWKAALQPAPQESVVESSQDWFAVGTQGNSKNIGFPGSAPTSKGLDHPAALASQHSPADGLMI